MEPRELTGASEMIHDCSVNVVSEKRSSLTRLGTAVEDQLDTIPWVKIPIDAAYTKEIEHNSIS